MSAIGRWLVALLFVVVIVYFVTFEIMLNVYGAAIGATSDWNVAAHVVIWVLVTLGVFVATMPLAKTLASLPGRLTNHSRLFALVALVIGAALVLFWAYGALTDGVDFDWEDERYAWFNRVVSIILIANVLKVPANLLTGGGTTDPVDDAVAHEA